MDNFLKELVAKERKLQEELNEHIKEMNKPAEKFAEDLIAKGETPHYYKVPDKGFKDIKEFEKVLFDPNSIFIL